MNKFNARVSIMVKLMLNCAFLQYNSNSFPKQRFNAELKTGKSMLLLFQTEIFSAVLLVSFLSMNLCDKDIRQ